MMPHNRLFLLVLTAFAVPMSSWSQTIELNDFLVGLDAIEEESGGTTKSVQRVFMEYEISGDGKPREFVFRLGELKTKPDGASLAPSISFPKGDPKTIGLSPLKWFYADDLSDSYLTFKVTCPEKTNCTVRLGINLPEGALTVERKLSMKETKNKTNVLDDQARIELLGKTKLARKSKGKPIAVRLIHKADTVTRVVASAGLDTDRLEATMFVALESSVAISVDWLVIGLGEIGATRQFVQPKRYLQAEASTKTGWSPWGDSTVSVAGDLIPSTSSRVETFEMAELAIRPETEPASFSVPRPPSAAGHGVAFIELTGVADSTTHVTRRDLSPLQSPGKIDTAAKQVSVIEVPQAEFTIASAQSKKRRLKFLSGNSTEVVLEGDDDEFEPKSNATVKAR
ncbi:MAG: hypothetical protein AAF664_24035, partial [Planctomycetota bacterium]